MIRKIGIRGIVRRTVMLALLTAVIGLVPVSSLAWAAGTSSSAAHYVYEARGGGEGGHGGGGGGHGGEGEGGGGHGGSGLGEEEEGSSGGSSGDTSYGGTSYGSTSYGGTWSGGGGSGGIYPSQGTPCDSSDGGTCGHDSTFFVWVAAAVGLLFAGWVAYIVIDALCAAARCGSDRPPPDGSDD